MTHDLVSTALAMKAVNPRRLFRIEWNGGVYWLKQREQENSKPIWLWPQKWLATLLRLDILQPTARRGGVKDLKSEEQRLKKLHAAGLPVPQVIASGSDWFIMADAGAWLPKVLPSFSPEKQRLLIDRALEGLLRFHAAGECHGRPMIKDMVVDDQDRVTLLDLEETPQDVMPLADAQARDILVFLSSVPPEEALIDKALAGSTAAARQSLRRLTRFFGPAAVLLKALTGTKSKKAKKINNIISLSIILREKIMSFPAE